VLARGKTGFIFRYVIEDVRVAEVGELCSNLESEIGMRCGFRRRCILLFVEGACRSSRDGVVL